MRWSLLLIIGCSGNVDVGPHPRTPKEVVCTGRIEPIPATRLLTRLEYDNALRDLLGDTTQPARSFPREPLVFGFDNNATVYQATPDAIQQYLQAAEFAAIRAVQDHKDMLVQCDVYNEACGASFVHSFGKRIFRRPLYEEEEEALATYFNVTFAQEASFDTALEWTLQVMLQSPQFLYKLEPGSAAPRRLSGFELATRLSFFLWASTPDTALLDAAQNGVLESDAGVTAQVDRMLSDPRHQDALDHFFDQWLGLEGLESIGKDPATYTTYPGRETLVSWRESVRRYLRDVVQNGGTLRDILLSPTMWVDPLLANLYGIPAPPSGSDFYRVDTDPLERVGLLGQPGLLALLASPDQSSPIRRGVFIGRRLACRSIGDPPADVPIIPPSLDSSATTRERFAQHSSAAQCNTCHRFIDPLGFGLEHFDGIGAYREQDAGKDVDARGAFVDFKEETLNGEFEGVGQLSVRLANSPQVHDCFVTQLFRYGMARVESENDACAIETIQQRFYDSGGDLRTLVREITQAEPFRQRAAVAHE